MANQKKIATRISHATKEERGHSVLFTIDIKRNGAFDRLIAAAFTGHRPHRFIFGYDEQHPLCKKLKRTMLEQISRLYEEHGVRVFYSGAALGVDLWGAGAVLYLRERKYLDLKLICAIPYPGHDAKWTSEQRERLQKILGEADYRVTISDKYASNAYERRNFFMVDCSQYLISVYDRQKNNQSGTIQTANYAERNRINIIYINPETAEVSDNFS